MFSDCLDLIFSHKPTLGICTLLPGDSFKGCTQARNLYILSNAEKLKEPQKACHGEERIWRKKEKGMDND